MPLKRRKKIKKQNKVKNERSASGRAGRRPLRALSLRLGITEFRWFNGQAQIKS